jgi:choline monooxygenase
MTALFVDPDIAKAKTLSTDFYTDPKYFQKAREKIFSRSWQFTGDTSLAKNPGQCFPISLLENYLDEPLLLTMDKQQQLHCVSNVCTHRGNLLVSSPCQVTNIRCRYHGRLFQLDGKFISMPEFKEVEDFPRPEDDLQELDLYQWGILLFTTLSSQRAAEEFLAPMKERMNWFPMEKLKYRPDLSKSYKVHAHWALYCENYLEGFHIPFVHSGLNAVIDYGSYTTELFDLSNLQLGIAKEQEDCFDLPTNAMDKGKNVAAYYFWVFPNMMFNFYPWGLSINIVKPVSLNQTRVEFLTYVLDESKLHAGVGSNLDKVEKEDEEVVENVQKGIYSRFYRHGRYSVTREQGTHHFHRLIAEFMNKE